MHLSAFWLLGMTRYESVWLCLFLKSEFTANTAFPFFTVRSPSRLGCARVLNDVRKEGRSRHWFLLLAQAWMLGDTWVPTYRNVAWHVAFHHWHHVAFLQEPWTHTSILFLLHIPIFAAWDPHVYWLNPCLCLFKSLFLLVTSFAGLLAKPLCGAISNWIEYNFIKLSRQDRSIKILDKLENINFQTPHISTNFLQVGSI